ncbi:DUF3040 domain-containing protein [Arthrobacter woluwensis]|uniref:DUF3040 domain-containing protein n=1 Tax=Arthrobacter woluwensis TaxID=156980 RepID=A0A1H4QW23_9MICC|nr:DUF3040 domain-containing protein [Arthrobacter woluwensis]QTF71214.1 DUF3040 domain-containing protein [Arthrobacter woluwensis]SEC23767.1 Protein of unknown function [Arthrobacter woluwensis]
MPLSEHEQRLLEQLERQLHEDDPKFASQMEQGAAHRWSTKRLVIGAFAVVAGILVLLLGVTLQNIVVGVLGFLVMGGGVYFATSKGKGLSPASGHRDTGARASRPRSGFMEDLEQRWEQRRREEP